MIIRCKLIILCFFHFFLLTSQSNFSNQYYEEGVKQLEKKNFQTADSLFTLSIKFFPDKDAYFNRALARKQLHKIDKYCDDLSLATMLNDKEAQETFILECGHIDTSYFFKNGIQATKQKYERLEIAIKSNFKDIERTYVYDNKGKVLTRYVALDSIQRLYIKPEVLPQFERNSNDMDWFIRKNIVYPSEVKKLGKSVFVQLSVIIHSDGTVGKIIGYGCGEKCDECLKEVEKAAMKMPRWKPGRFDGHPVTTIGQVFFKFDIDKAR